MKPLSQYSLLDHLRCRSLHDIIKEIRNDIVSKRFICQAAEHEETFLNKHQHLHNLTVVAVIAFEQPLALGWLLTQMQRHAKDCTVLVFDNSLDQHLRQEIQTVCQQHGVGYLGLPPNRTRHVNRSHALAMNWVYSRILRKLEPNLFGFLDHDMLLMQPLKLSEKLNDRVCYGHARPGFFGSWYLWAGYCFFHYPSVREIALNFMYDFSMDLDTGGRNWEALYRNLAPSQWASATQVMKTIRCQQLAESREVEYIDDAWLHIGGISYNQNFDHKRQFFEAFFAEQSQVVAPVAV